MCISVRLIDTRGNDPPFQIVGEHNVRANHTRIVSYSLYGNKEKYLVGMLHNIRVIHERMPGWTVRIYLNNQVPPEYVHNLMKDTGIEVITVDDTAVKPGNGAGTFWRFLALCEPDKDVVIVDADNELDPPQIHEILQFFAHKGRPYMFTGRTWPWPSRHVGAGYIFKKKQIGAMPFTADQVIHWPLRVPFGADEYFTTLMIGETLPLRDLNIRHDPSLPFVRNRVASRFASRMQNQVNH